VNLVHIEKYKADFMIGNQRLGSKVFSRLVLWLDKEENNKTSSVNIVYLTSCFFGEAACSLYEMGNL
jgi:hypothetical protein